MLEAVIFDMDGVIVDSEPGYLTALKEVLGAYGLKVGRHYHERFVGKSSIEAWTIIREESGITDKTAEQCVEAMNAARKRLLKKEGYRPIKGTLPLIRALYREGITLAIASSNTFEEIHQVIKELGLDGYFREIVSGAEECAHSKPDPEVFVKAVEKLGVEKERCLIIEDSNNGAKAGKGAGVRVLGFRNPEIGNQSLEDADYVVDDMQKVDVKLCRKVCGGR
ncbi:MAG: HAD family phosphatase [Dorea sp.]|jgi:HAD superfamily hydrolase (TIGR01509 family)|nr:HAD family phosphatase [Dorea sp.]